MNKDLISRLEIAADYRASLKEPTLSFLIREAAQAVRDMQTKIEQILAANEVAAKCWTETMDRNEVLERVRDAADLFLDADSESERMELEVNLDLLVAETAK